jgi:hypothetical protein
MVEFQGGEELVYDLRQKYAEIVGFHLEEVSNARKSQDYSTYFKALEDLFTVVKHKFRNKKIEGEEDTEYSPTFTEKKQDKEKKADKKTDLERYTELRQNVITLSNKYKSAFLRQTEDPNEIAIIENSLREIEMFLYYVMDKAKMFGAYASNRGL